MKFHTGVFKLENIFVKYYVSWDNIESRTCKLRLHILIACLGLALPCCYAWPPSLTAFLSYSCCYWILLLLQLGVVNALSRFIKGMITIYSCTLNEGFRSKFTEDYLYWRILEARGAKRLYDNKDEDNNPNFNNVLIIPDPRN